VHFLLRWGQKKKIEVESSAPHSSGSIYGRHYAQQRHKGQNGAGLQCQPQSPACSANKGLGVDELIMQGAYRVEDMN